MWTEEQITAALDGHFYSLTFDPFAKVVDLAMDDTAKKLRPWTDDDLRELLDLKRRGFTVDAIAAETGRGLRSIGDVWARRDRWMPEIDQPAFPPPPVVQPVPAPLVGIVALEDIRRVVCLTYKVGKNDFVSVARHMAAVEARHAFFSIARRFTEKSYSRIGEFCGNRDHATVRHGAAKVERRFTDYQAKIEACLASLGLSLDRQREAA